MPGHITRIAIFLILFIAEIASAQPYCRVRTFNVRDGLPSNNVSTIIQDDEGLIWTSTWNGLCYFDGYNFTSFRSSQDNGWLSTNRILLIKHNSKNDIWVITYDRQLYLFDSKLSKFIDVGDIVKEKTGIEFHPRNIYPVRGGHTWITGHGDRTAIRVCDNFPTDMDSMIVVKPRESNGNGYLHKVENDQAGREWLFYDDHIELAGTKVSQKGRFEHIANVGDATYLATRRGNLYRYRPGSNELNAIRHSADASAINCLATFDDNNLLIGTNDGIYVYDCRKGKSRKIQTGAKSTLSSNVTDIYVDSKARVWAFTSDKGVMLVDPWEATARHLETSAETQATTGSRRPIWLEDQFGTIWVVPRHGVFGYYDENADCIRPYPLQTPHFGFADVPEIERFFVDKNNNLWLSSFHDLMLINFKRPVVKRIPLIKNQETRSLLAREDGDIWAGTNGGSIGVFNEDGSFRHFIGISQGGKIYTSQSPVKFSDKIYALFEDSRGWIWVGTKGLGLFIIYPNGSVVRYCHDKSTPNSLNCDNIYAFDEDEKGNMWIASYGGGVNLAVIDGTDVLKFVHAGNDMQHYPLPDFANVRRITHDGLGNVIASCSEGLLTFNNKFDEVSKIKFQPTKQINREASDLRTGNVMQTLVTSSGVIIVSTMGGDIQAIETANLQQPQLTFKSYGPESNAAVPPLAEGNVLSMIEDNFGNICVTSDASMTIYSPQTGNIISLGPNELGENIEFTEGQPVSVSKSGRLLLPTVGGLISFSPQDLVQSSHSPKIIFTNVMYQGTNKNVSILHNNTLEVPADKRDLSVEFAALDYGSDKSIQYAYKLEGIDDWTYAGTSNSARLNHLSPGFQRLLVKSTNNDGAWTDNIHSLDIFVNPTFWETPVAKLIYVFIAVLIIIIAFHIYELRRKNAMHQELDNMKNKFFADMSHKLRTPLTLISGPVNEVLHDPSIDNKSRQHLRTVLRNSDNMLDLVNRMLRWSQDNGVYISDENVVTVASIDQVGNYPGDETYEPEIQTVANSKSVKLLIVEDNDELRNFLRGILVTNYTVEVASNGREGLEKAESWQPDFIITDVTMPEMDGLTMVSHLKANQSLSHIPIIVLSAKASVSDRMHGLKMGIDDYITKPFSASYLKQRIANIIIQRHTLQQTYLGLLGSQLPTMTNNGNTVIDNDTENNSDYQSISDHQQIENDETTATVSSDTNDNPSSQNDNDIRGDYRLASPQIADADQEMMTRLLKFLESRIDDENLKIEELAEAVNLGRTVFYGKIKSLVGVSPSDFLRHIRMQRAAELIAKSKMNFSQIAFNVGFSDPKYFTKCFKKETGMTPSEYRTHARNHAGETGDNENESLKQN